MPKFLPFPRHGTDVKIASYRMFSKLLSHARMCDDDGCIMCRKRIGRAKT